VKAFSFRLEKVLKYRKYVQKKAQRELSAARRAYGKETAAAKKLAEQRMQIAEETRRETTRGVEVPRYRFYLASMYQCDTQLEEAELAIEERRREVSAREGALRKASRESKILEKLKGQQFNRYRENMQREEQKILDELVIRRRGKRA
jgi:flagellar export protein FliJ